MIKNSQIDQNSQKNCQNLARNCQKMVGKWSKDRYKIMKMDEKWENTFKNVSAHFMNEF